MQNKNDRGIWMGSSEFLNHSKYNTGKRAIEVSILLLSVILLTLNGYYIFEFYRQCGTIKQGIICGIGGMLTADFLSGMVHWMADTWGTTNLPIVGENILKPFRQHHVDPTSITRHDFVETNSSNFAILIPGLVGMLWKFWTNSIEQIHSKYSWFLYFYCLGFFVAYTNQIHKWSHTYFDLPKLITILQKYRIILPQKQHRYHHIAPHDTYYCITTGWLNYPLERLQFWSTLERIVTKLTGCKPRSDDLRWAELEKQKTGRSFVN